jgi:hypothetical protein
MAAMSLAQHAEEGTRKVDERLARARHGGEARASHMIFWKQVLSASYADRIRRERFDASRSAAFPPSTISPA